MKKVLIGAAIAVVVVIVVVAYGLYASLDSLVKSAIETYGSRYTGTSVEVDAVEISPAAGTGALSGFWIANPKTFDTPTAIEVDSLSIAIDISSVTSDPIIISDISVDRPMVTYEIGADGKSNIDEISEHVKAATGSGQSEGGDGKSSADGGGKKLIIESLNITNGVVSVSGPLMQGQTLASDLPNIHLTDIGKEKGGATPAQVAEQLAAVLQEHITASVSQLDLEGLLSTGAAKKALEDAVGGETKGAVEEGLGKAKDLFK